jgi:hypothetical protein
LLPRSPLPNTALGTNDIGYPPRFDPYVMPVDLVTPGNSKNVSQPTTSNVYLSFSPPEVFFSSKIFFFIIVKCHSSLCVVYKAYNFEDTETDRMYTYLLYDLCFLEDRFI